MTHQMTHIEEKGTLSLRAEEALIKIKSKQAMLHEHKIHKYMDELKKGNINNQHNYSEHIKDFFNNDLEGIKHISYKDKHKRFEYFEPQIIAEIQVEFDIVLKKIVDDFQQEKEDERSLKESNQLRNKTFKSFVKKTRNLLKRTIKDTRKENKFLEKEKDIINSIFIIREHLNSSTINTQDVSKTKDHLKKLLIGYTHVLLEEFEILFDIDENIQLEEIDLIESIEVAIKKTKKLFPDIGLEEVIELIKTKLDEDYYILRRMTIKARELHTQVDSNLSHIKKHLEESNLHNYIELSEYITSGSISRQDKIMYFDKIVLLNNKLSNDDVAMLKEKKLYKDIKEFALIIVKNLVAKIQQHMNDTLPFAKNIHPLQKHIESANKAAELIDTYKIKSIERDKIFAPFIIDFLVKSRQFINSYMSGATTDYLIIIKYLNIIMSYKIITINEKNNHSERYKLIFQQIIEIINRGIEKSNLGYPNRVHTIMIVDKLIEVANIFSYESVPTLNQIKKEIKKISDNKNKALAA